MNTEKLAKLQAMAAAVRTGGPGSMRRKKKVVHRASASAEDQKLQGSLKKLGVSQIPGIDEVNMFMENGVDVIHFKNPRIQANPQANTYVISGNAENKTTSEIPDMSSQIDPSNMELIRQLMAQVQAQKGAQGAADDDDIPEMVNANFEQPAAETPSA
eukprot:TRINITY_DN189_c0_g1_i2.p1 TRINITY_DN189_c0_g1~~TRINITY_DN189_c0_g1_i2.p1  ORF type:complete len:179 (-),score=119.96 TRINITY_DN189_c0_g1_i2:110-583(-)